MKIYSNNKKAYYEYEILDKYEGGLVLQGSEVKSIKEGKASIKESYLRFLNSELFVVGMYIGEYSNAGYANHKLDRNKKILLNRAEIKKIKKFVEIKGHTLIPLQLYLKNNFIKLLFGCAKAKKLYDKRKDKTDRDISRRIERELKKK